mgnify:CR=1 FL=1
MKIAFVHNLQRSKDEMEAEFDTPEVVDAISKEFISYKKTSKDIEKMTYKFVQDRFWTIIKFLTNDPTDDKNYSKYFGF